MTPGGGSLGRGDYWQLFLFPGFGSELAQPGRQEMVSWDVMPSSGHGGGWEGALSTPQAGPFGDEVGAGSASGRVGTGLGMWEELENEAGAQLSKKV